MDVRPWVQTYTVNPDRGIVRKHSQPCVLCYLLGRGEVGAVGACGAVFGGGAAGDVVRVRQRPALHLRQHTLLVEQRLEEPCVAVKLHQVEDLQKRKEIINQWNEVNSKGLKREGQRTNKKRRDKQNEGREEEKQMLTDVENTWEEVQV